jgi:hypothetical protein
MNPSDPLPPANPKHPVATGAGAVGAGAAGATVGALVGGPVGALVGGAVAAVAGGLGGRVIAEVFNPSDEERYWREHYRTRPYAKPDTRFEELEPAYRYGWETRAAHPRECWEDLEQRLEEGWRCRGCERPWEAARDPARDAFERLEGALFHDPERPRR